jgi:hypothetical protein
MKKTLILTATFVISALTMSCATNNTTFQSTWKNPEAPRLDLHGRKVVAVFMSSNDSVRYRAEDAIAAELTARGADGVAAHTFLTDADIRDADVVQQKARDAGFIAAVIVRITGNDTQYRYNPGPGVFGGGPYRHLWGPGYWRWGWGTVGAPGYLSVDKIVRAETLVYSTESDELVWSAVSRTFDPGHIDSFMSELTKDVAKRMTKDGVLTASASL